MATKNEERAGKVGQDKPNQDFRCVVDAETGTYEDAAFERGPFGDTGAAPQAPKPYVLGGGK